MSGVADLSQASLTKFAGVAKDKVVLLTGTTEIGNLLAVQFANAGYFDLGLQFGILDISLSLFIQRKNSDR